MRVLFILIAILAIAFLFAIGHKPPQAIADLSATPRWMQWLGGRTRPSFDFRAIPPGCFHHDTQLFVAASVCVTRITPSPGGERFRLLKLSLYSGTNATVDFTPAAEDRSSVPAFPRTLATARPETFTIGPMGGALQISCPPAANCSVQAE